MGGGEGQGLFICISIGKNSLLIAISYLQWTDLESRSKELRGTERPQNQNQAAERMCCKECIVFHESITFSEYSPQ